MIPVVQKGLIQTLEGRHFGRCVDLGCGWGDGGRILRSHVDYLIGVDKSEAWLEQAKSTGTYDECVLSDVRGYYPYADLVVLMDVVEHLSHKDGEDLLNRLMYIPNIVISTPLEFFRNPSSMPHLSLWKEEELWHYRFSTRILVGWFQPMVILGRRFQSDN